MDPHALFQSFVMPETRPADRSVFARVVIRDSAIQGSGQARPSIPKDKYSSRH